MPLKPQSRLDASVKRLPVADKVTDPLLPSQRLRHYPYLDATRIICVIGVAIDHGSPQFGVWNVVFTQNWVLQLLFVTSGAAFAMSRQGLCGYLGRLSFYFVLGVTINLMAWVYAGLDWRHNIFDVVFQFWFIAGLMANSILLYPLKLFLIKVHSDSVRTWGADDPDLLFELPATRAAIDSHAEAASQPEPEPRIAAAGADAEAETDVKDTEALDESSRAPISEYEALGRGAKAIAFIALSVATVIVITMSVLEPALQHVLGSALVQLFKSSESGMGAGLRYWLPVDAESARAAVHGLCCYLQCSLSSVCIVLLFPRLHKRTSLVGWLVLLNMFLHRVLVERRSEERPFHGFDLFLAALVIAHLGLRHREKVGNYVCRYWFIWIISCGLIWLPGTHERLDSFPPGDMPTRVRFNILESFFMIAWLTCGEWLFDGKIFSEDKLDFMNNWALAVFLLHKAIHILTKWPLNWTLILAMIPFCWLWKRRKTSL